ncbi:MAG TPA: zf-HC2 domain-containing protein [Gemmatimonadota bacterium]|nr:zf-HC2 domain-containing protein [Gemmatimonadota bacterium]
MTGVIPGPGAHPDEASLNDFVDGLLGEPEAGRVRSHLEACERCRAEVRGLRALVEEASRLPSSVEPPAALWAAVARRTVGKARSRRRMRFRPGRWELAAAAVLLVALSSLVTAVLLRSGSGGTAAGTPGMRVAAGGPPPTAGAAAPAPDPATVLEASYAPSVASLRARFEARRSQLSPETVEIVERNLAVIDSALAQTRAVLESDPASRPAAHLMAAMYRQKIGLLERTLRMGT